jgi:hypothetical protein
MNYSLYFDKFVVYPICLCGAPPRRIRHSDVRVAAALLSKQSRTVDKGWSSSLGVGRGANFLTVKEQLAAKCYTGPRTWRALMNTAMILRVP